MSVSAVSGSNWVNYENQSVQSNIQQFQQDFQQLGEDLQAGNLSAAQTDFTTLQSLSPQSSSSSTSSTSSTSTSPIAQEFQQLSQALQSGNLSAAQQDYSQLQQDFQSQSAEGQHHRHHHGGGSSEISQLFSQLGQDLQSGSLSAAQQVYASLQQTFQGLTTGQSSTPQSSLTGTSAVSVTA
jgi:outer membrane protein assembly factor BamD (BamD/ComL family)